MRPDDSARLPVLIQHDFHLQAGRRVDNQDSCRQARLDLERDVKRHVLGQRSFDRLERALPRDSAVAVDLDDGIGPNVEKVLGNVGEVPRFQEASPQGVHGCIIKCLLVRGGVTLITLAPPARTNVQLHPPFLTAGGVSLNPLNAPPVSVTNMKPLRFPLRARAKRRPRPLSRSAGAVRAKDRFAERLQLWIAAIGVYFP